MSTGSEKGLIGSTKDSLEMAGGGIEMIPITPEYQKQLRSEKSKQILKAVFPITVERYMEVFV